MSRTPDQIPAGELVVAKRERYALRRYTRQLTSSARKDADREVVYLDPSLAQSMMRKGLVKDLKGRGAEALVLDQFGRVISRDGKLETHVSTVLTPKAIYMLDGLARMEND